MIIDRHEGSSNNAFAPSVDGRPPHSVATRQLAAVRHRATAGGGESFIVQFQNDSRPLSPKLIAEDPRNKGLACLRRIYDCRTSSLKTIGTGRLCSWHPETDVVRSLLDSRHIRAGMARPTLEAFGGWSRQRCSRWRSCESSIVSQCPVAIGNVGTLLIMASPCSYPPKAGRTCSQRTEYTGCYRRPSFHNHDDHEFQIEIVYICLHVLLCW
jgi:hypothetical protein